MDDMTIEQQAARTMATFDARVHRPMTRGQVEIVLERHRQAAPSLERKGHQKVNRKRGFYSRRYWTICLSMADLGG